MIPYGRHHIDEDDIAAVVDLLRNGPLTQGPVIENFENAIADYVGAKYAVAVSSCTAALHMSAVTSGVKEGKSLVTSPITFVSTSNAAFYAGGKPEFSDIDPKTINLCPIRLKETLNELKDVAAIAPVHFGGLACDMKSIKAVADQKGALVFEDAAHALGATYEDGQKVGSCAHSAMTAFSFHPVKQIAAGEGGMITTNDEAIYRSLLRFRSHGINKMDDKFVIKEQAFTNDIANPWYYEMLELGMHYRITDIQCALGLSQLNKLEKFITRRRQLAAQYDKEFKNWQRISPTQPMNRDQSGLHIYVVRINFKALNTTRAEFMLALREKGIGSQVHYNPVPSNPFYRSKGYKPEDYPLAMDYYRNALSIPLYYDLTDEQQSYIISVLAFLTNN